MNRKQSQALHTSLLALIGLSACNESPATLAPGEPVDGAVVAPMTASSQAVFTQAQVVTEDDTKSWPRVYLHFDYMVAEGVKGHSHAPSEAAIQMVVEAFYRRGIILDIDPIHNRIPEVKYTHFGEVLPGACVGKGSATFYDLKNRYFQPRQANEHYALFSHYTNCEGAPLTGSSAMNGYDFIISLGSFIDQRRELTDAIVAGTFMHELGHNFGLRHGGGNSDTNSKPNYISVMNYSHQFGIATAANPGTHEPVGFRVDYSDRVLPALSEIDGFKDELGHGIDDKESTDLMVYYCYDENGVVVKNYTSLRAGAIDWNCDGAMSDTTTTAPHDVFDIFTGEGDINNDHQLSVLTGFDDWTYIRQYLKDEAKKLGQ